MQRQKAKNFIWAKASVYDILPLTLSLSLYVCVSVSWWCFLGQSVPTSDWQDKHIEAISHNNLVNTLTAHIHTHINARK